MWQRINWKRLKKRGFTGYYPWEQRDILELYLKRHPKGVIAPEVASELGSTQGTVRKRLKELVRRRKAIARKICYFCIYYPKEERR